MNELIAGKIIKYEAVYVYLHFILINKLIPLLIPVFSFIFVFSNTTVNSRLHD